MNGLDNLTIRGKLVVILLSVATLTLFLASATGVYYDYKNGKKNMLRHLSVLADAVGNNSRAALIFDDAPAAVMILSSLREEPQIVSAALYDTMDKVFAVYNRDGTAPLPPQTPKEERAASGEYIEIVRPIVLEGDTVGKFYLRAHTRELDILLKNSIAQGGLIFIVALALSVVLAIKLQKIISKPILSLADAAKKISQSPDYSIRVRHDSRDEMGVLFSGFNEMLSQIEKRDRELARHRTQLEDLVKERTAELEAALKELVLKEKLAALGQLTAMVSHEIRNPLGTIRNAIFSIANSLKEKGDATQQALELAERNIHRCDAIIEELLDFTRPQELNLEATNIDAWLNELLDELRIPPGIAVERKTLSATAIDLDREQFRRAVTNIVENACQAIAEKLVTSGGPAENLAGGYLEVETRVRDGRLEVRIADNGIGIAPDQIKKIFEPLYSTKGFGVGLGLTIVKKSMEFLKGGIGIESQPGKGTAVVLWLPFKKAKPLPRETGPGVDSEKA